MEYREFTAKTVDDAITDACQSLSVTSDKLDYVVVDEGGSTGFLGLKSKPAIIKARVKDSLEDRVKGFLNDVLGAMNIEATIKIVYDR